MNFEEAADAEGRPAVARRPASTADFGWFLIGLGVAVGGIFLLVLFR